jgi:anaerobic selenocysteine-containing dehydrogenase
VATPRTRIDMQNKPSPEQVLDLVASGSRIPLQRLRENPGQVIFDEEPVHVEERDAHDTARLFVGSALMFEELRAFRAGDPFARPGHDYRLLSRRMPNTFNSVGTDIEELTRRYGTNPAFMNPGDLAREGLARGDVVRVVSAHGEIDAVAWPDPDLRPGLVSMCHCWGTLPGDPADVRKTGSNTGMLISVTEDCARFSAIPLMSALPVAVRRV